MINPFEPLPNPALRHRAASAFRIPVRCTDCRRRFNPRDPHRRLQTLEDQLALCSQCTWHLEHPDEARD
jgi:hypothetical protein